MAVRLLANRRTMILFFVFCLVFAACGSDDNTSHTGNGDEEISEQESETVAGEWPVPPKSLAVTVERPVAGEAVSEEEVGDFTQTMTAFFKHSDYFRWAWRHSLGLAHDNPWNQPGYRIWWTNAYAVKENGVVTIRWHRPSDNSTAKVTRVLVPALSLYMTSGDEAAGELALDLIRGLSALYDGYVWGDEDPVEDTLMARAIFHRNHQYELDGGRIAAIDYDSVRYDIEERRHDTWHNPDNPTWGDIYVRNKRSKDDFPYLYRCVPMLIRVVNETQNAELKTAAEKLLGQLRGMTGDIVENAYQIRSKDSEGKPFLPVTDAGLPEDFSSFTNFEVVFPNAECNAKISTAYIATGTALDNDCGQGDGGGYEDVAIGAQFWASNMIWGYHITAMSLALTMGDTSTAKNLLAGLVARADEIVHDPAAENESLWMPDVAQWLVLAAAYGLPLTNEEARLVQKHYAEGAKHYNEVTYWDLWDDDISDGEYEYIPDRNTTDQNGEILESFVRITEIVDLFEYCYSPLKDPAGATFIDCESLLDPSTWSSEPAEK